jgi:carboxypeptidase PM20D1
MTARFIIVFLFLLAGVALAAPLELTPAQRRALASVDWAAVRETGAKHLSELIRIKSLPGEEALAADYLERAAREVGLHPQRLDGGGTWNVYVGTRLDAPPKLLLLSHLDTVPATADAWTHPPFSGARADGAVWGRGAADAKGQAVIHMMALSVIRRIDPEYPAPLAMLSVSDEEDGGDGAAYVIANHAARLAKAPIIGEGGVGIAGLPIMPHGEPVYGVATAEKSALWIKLTLEIPASGHGSVPPAEYANRQMVLALNRLLTTKMPLKLIPASRTMLANLARYHDFPKNFALTHPDWPLIKQVLDKQLSAEPLTNAIVRDTATLTGLETESGANNSIPRRVVARLDCRLLPGSDEAAFLAQMKTFLKDDRIQITVLKRSPRSDGTTPGRVFDALAGALAEAEPTALVTPMVFPASSDNNAFRQAGHEAYGLFPVRLTRQELEAIHGVDERLTEKAIEQGVRILVDVMLRLRGTGQGK